MYWSAAQIVAHHSSNGCNLQPGDLIGTGTLSTEDEGGLGSLLEISRGGKQPVDLASGETRTFLEDGDEVTLRASCEAEGAVRIGLGECVERWSQPRRHSVCAREVGAGFSPLITGIYRLFAGYGPLARHCGAGGANKPLMIRSILVPTFSTRHVGNRMDNRLRNRVRTGSKPSYSPHMTHGAHYDRCQ